MGAGALSSPRRGSDEERLGELIDTKCSLLAGPSRHAPRVVFIVHPLLSGTEFARSLVKSAEHRLFVQSAGTEVSGVRGAQEDTDCALVDRLYAFLLAEALKLGDQPDNPDAALLPWTPEMETAVVLAPLVARVEQLTARVRLADAGICVCDSEMYALLCRHNPTTLRETAKRAMYEREARALSYRSDGQYSAEWYGAVAVRPHDEPSAAAAPEGYAREPAHDKAQHELHVQQLSGRREFCVNALEGAPAQVEVFSSAPEIDAALLEHTLHMEYGGRGKPNAVHLALQRTEQMLTAAMYTPENTLYMVISVSEEFVRWTMACVYQRLLAMHPHMPHRVSLELMTRLRTTVSTVWTRLLGHLHDAEHLEYYKHVATMTFQDAPGIAEEFQARPSQWLAEKWRLSATTFVSRAATFIAAEMLEGRPRQPVGVVHNLHGDGTRLCTVNCLGGWRYDISVFMSLMHSDHLQSWQTLNTQFEHLFGCEYNDSAYASRLDAQVPRVRPPSRVKTPSEAAAVAAAQ